MYNFRRFKKVTFRIWASSPIVILPGPRRSVRPLFCRRVWVISMHPRTVQHLRCKLQSARALAPQHKLMHLPDNANINLVMRVYIINGVKLKREFSLFYQQLLQRFFYFSLSSLSVNHSTNWRIVAHGQQSCFTCRVHLYTDIPAHYIPALTELHITYPHTHRTTHYILAHSPNYT